MQAAGLPGQGLAFFFVLATVVGLSAAVIVHLRRRLESLQRENAVFAKEKEAVYAFLKRIGAKMSKSVDLEGALESIVAFLVEATDAQAGAVFLMESDRQSLRARVLVGLFPPLQKTFDYALTKKKFLHQKMKKERIAVGEGIIGQVAAERRAVLIRNAREDSRVAQTKGLEIETLIAAPLMVDDEVEGVFALVNRSDGAPFSEDDLDVLRALAEQASVTIQVVRMYEAMAEKQRIEQELGVARDFQKLLLPKQCPRVPGIDIAAVSRPALEVGGDFYDFFWIDGHRLGIAIADVAGKGVPGALIMAMVRSVVRAEGRRAVSPRDVLERVNETVLADTRENVFVTMTFAVLDLRRRTLTFARAGHEPLVAYSRGDDSLRLLAPEGIALGLVGREAFSAIRDCEVTLRDGDMAMLYTDGVVEAAGKNGREYGQERFLELLRASAQSPAEDIVQAVLDDVDRYTVGGHQADDITLVVMKFDDLAQAAQCGGEEKITGQEGEIETI